MIRANEKKGRLRQMMEGRKIGCGLQNAGLDQRIQLCRFYKKDRAKRLHISALRILRSTVDNAIKANCRLSPLFVIRRTFLALLGAPGLVEGSRFEF
jgi:hypothetical protein